MAEQIEQMNRLTFGQRFHGDDITAVSPAGRSHRHHPDTVLPVATEIVNPVQEFIWGHFKLTDHLNETQNK